MENSVMFFVGVVIFVLYLSGYMMMVKRQNEIQKKQSEPKKTDEVDFDGHGNWGRFSQPKVRNKVRKINSRL